MQSSTSSKGQGWRAVPGGLVCRVGDGCEQGHLHGRQSACHFCSRTCCHQGDRRQCGQDSAADSLSEAAVIKLAPATPDHRLHTAWKQKLASKCITDLPKTYTGGGRIINKKERKTCQGFVGAPLNVTRICFFLNK